MFSNSELQTIVWTSNADKAKHFYSNVSGLRFIKTSHGALVYDVNGGCLRVSPVPSTGPSEHTVLGFSIPDIHAAVRRLDAHGIELERFPGFAQGDNHILNISNGDKVAWFRDPDGNLLSAVQYAPESTGGSPATA